MKYSALIPFLILNWTACFGQSFQPNSFQKRAILRDHAELVRLRADAVADSLTIINLSKAYQAQDSALYFCQSAQAESAHIIQGLRDSFTIAERQRDQAIKQVRKEKFLKWVGFGLAGIMAILSASR